jgi:CheY-like chemotaxis protein
MTKTKEAVFLIVDDDTVSVMAMQRAMRKLKILNETIVCKDGQEAWEFLKGKVDAGQPLGPMIVMLDLNMPRMGGLEFLQTVRDDPKLKHIIVFVFTTSDMPTDVHSAYANNVAGYIVKEHPSETFSEALDMLDSYVRIVELPV